MFWFCLLFVFSLFVNIQAQRNAEAEAKCQPFLTSPKTAPLTSLKRNIAVDEEGEFYCELVLQDRFVFTSPNSITSNSS